jgi:MULE transposase domain
MPLFTITGVTSMKLSFTVGMAFLGGETFQKFQWVIRHLRHLYQDSPLNAPYTVVTDCDTALMNAVKDVFPTSQNLLCLWHIFKNITAHCQSTFSAKGDKDQQEEGKEAWKEFSGNSWGVVRSKSITIFEANWNMFCEKYQEFPTILDYIRKQWLPFKVHFVYAWTNQQLHFETRATSRAEGLHSSLKKYLIINTGDLKSVHEKITHFLLRQINEHQGKIEQAKNKTYWSYRGSFFDEIRQFVTPPALLEIKKQMELVQDPPKPCSGHFRSSMGLPCHHEINRIKGEGRNLRLNG